MISPWNLLGFFIPQPTYVVEEFNLEDDYDFPLRKAPNGEGLIDVASNRYALTAVLSEKWWRALEADAIQAGGGFYD